MPRLSVITICFNDREGLEKTMNSVLAQTFADMEYIVIDGGSTDGSREVMEKQRNELSYCISEKDNGIYNAQNKGWRHASGEYCLFLNSGDVLQSESVLEKIFALNSPADIIYGDLLVDNRKDPLYRLSQPDPFTFDDFIYTTMFHPATFIRRKLLEDRGGYDESFRIVADYDFFLEMLMVKKCSSAYVPIPVAIFNTEGIGSDPENKRLHDEERRRAQLKYFPETVIAEAERRVRKRKPRSQRLKDATAQIPLVRDLTSFGLHVYQKFRSRN